MEARDALGSVARIACRSQLFERVAEAGFIALLDDAGHLVQHRRESRLRRRSALRTAFECVLESEVDLLNLVAGIGPVPIHATPVQLSVAIPDLDHRDVESSKVARDGIPAGLGLARKPSAASCRAVLAADAQRYSGHEKHGQHASARISVSHRVPPAAPIPRDADAPAPGKGAGAQRRPIRRGPRRAGASSPRARHS